MKKFTIYLAGDSTVQSYKTPVKPITGWGQMLHTYFKETEQKMNQDGCDWMGYGQKSASDFDQSANSTKADSEAILPNRTQMVSLRALTNNHTPLQKIICKYSRTMV